MNHKHEKKICEICGKVIFQCRCIEGRRNVTYGICEDCQKPKIVIDKEKAKKAQMKEGFYYLSSPDDPEPVLVHGYKSKDMDNQFIFGFNTHDGGGFVPLSDLTEETIVTPVEIRKVK